ncbi:MAG: methylmalonyl-CoA mutase, partial [Clostridia bacterium]|nr:methylmalonyl-CoA mutase [Clostridia bacterium]
MSGATYQKDGDEIKEVTLESGIKVKPVYTPEDLKGWEYQQDLGNPGEFPYTRGIHPEMYRKRPWTIRQYAGFGTPEETNERFKYLIANGQTGLNVAFDLPTQLGIDSDDPLAEGEVGRVGMAVDTLRDFEIAFAGIKLDSIGSSL